MIAEKLQLNTKYVVETTPDLDPEWVVSQVEEVLKRHRDQEDIAAHIAWGARYTTWGLAYHTMDYVPDKTQWLTKEGKLPKRIAKALREYFDIRLDNNTISALGETLRRQLQQDATHYIDLTTHFNWDSGDFGDEGSCFWTYNEDAKRMIYDAGGFAIREFTNDTYTIGKARCWCIPEDGVYYIFNAYPKTMRLESFAAMLVKLTGFQMERVSLSNYGSTGNTLYLNSGSGIAIFPEGVTPDSVHDFEIEDQNRIRCSNCGDYYDEDDTRYHNDEAYCDVCFNELFAYCDYCNESFEHDELHHCISDRGYDHDYCTECAERKGYHECASCGDWKESCTDIGSEYLCSSCYAEQVVECSECGEVLDISGSIASLADAIEYDDEYYCEDCLKEHKKDRCPHCHNKLEPDEERLTLDGSYVCVPCYQRHAQKRDGYHQEEIL